MAKIQQINLSASLREMVNKLGKWTIINEFDSHWVPILLTLRWIKPSLVNHNKKLLVGLLGGVRVSVLDARVVISDFDSHWGLHTSDFELN